MDKSERKQFYLENPYGQFLRGYPRPHTIIKRIRKQIWWKGYLGPTGIDYKKFTLHLKGVNSRIGLKNRINEFLTAHYNVAISTGWDDIIGTKDEAAANIDAIDKDDIHRIRLPIDSPIRQSLLKWYADVEEKYRRAPHHLEIYL